MDYQLSHATLSDHTQFHTADRVNQQDDLCFRTKRIIAQSSQPVNPELKFYVRVCDGGLSAKVNCVGRVGISG